MMPRKLAAAAGWLAEFGIEPGDATFTRAATVSRNRAVDDLDRHLLALAEGKVFDRALR